MSNLWGREPAAVVAFVGAVVTLLVAFGVELTQEQQAAIGAVVIALMAVVTRHNVTPS